MSCETEPGRVRDNVKSRLEEDCQITDLLHCISERLCAARHPPKKDQKRWGSLCEEGEGSRSFPLPLSSLYPATNEKKVPPSEFPRGRWPWEWQQEGAHFAKSSSALWPKGRTKCTAIDGPNLRGHITITVFGSRAHCTARVSYRVAISGIKTVAAQQKARGDRHAQRCTTAARLIAGIAVYVCKRNGMQKRGAFMLTYFM